jgi:hypothetical protein
MKDYVPYLLLYFLLCIHIDLGYSFVLLSLDIYFFLNLEINIRIRPV